MKTSFKLSVFALAFASSAAWGQAAPTVCNNDEAPNPAITIAVASNFYEPAKVLAGMFAATPEGDGAVIRVCHNSTGNLMTEITTDENLAGYSLLLAADTDAPAVLKKDYADRIVGEPFTYTEGVPILWTNTDGVNISTGDVTNSTVVSLALGLPAKAPYGKAGVQILKRTGQFADVVSKIAYYDNIALTKNAIENGEKSAGYIAKSQVCNNGEVSGKGYFYDFPAGAYDPVTQDGVVLNKGDSSLAQSFVTYLLDSTAQTNLVDVFCYKPLP